MNDSRSPSPGRPPQRFGASVRSALCGLWLALRTERNLRLHGVAAIVAMAMLVWLGGTAAEWGVLILTITLVVATEVLNSSIERLVDLVSPDWNDQAGQVKDIAAGGVLLTALASIAVGIILFGPKLWGLLQTWLASSG
ncbi:MAG: diacylglycerol kinase family protein [Planctomycetaceae bacterium]|nr:diacylglycerol kinase family protein [Planctomycetaceae bacterium]